jgi:hypothetical protein
MATSVVSIWNDALVEIGSKANVEDVDEGSTQSEAFKEIYETKRDMLLERLEWPFANAHVVASILVTANNPHPLYVYWYTAPPDSIVIREILGATHRPRALTGFEEFDDSTQGRVFATDDDSANIRYTRRITDVRKFSAGFTDTLVYELAAAVSMKLTSKRTIKKDMEESARRAYSAAAAGVPGKMTVDEDSEFIAERA